MPFNREALTKVIAALLHRVYLDHLGGYLSTPKISEIDIKEKRGRNKPKVA